MGRNLRLDEAAYQAILARQRGKAAEPRPTAKNAPCVAVAGDKWPLALDQQLRLIGINAQVLEHRFAPHRKWRFDLAYPAILFAVEVDGMVHRIKERFVADLEKHQAAFAAGWRVLRVSPAQVRSGEARQLVEQALRQNDLRTGKLEGERHLQKIG
mgnify:CR=1 FL=1